MSVLTNKSIERIGGISNTGGLKTPGEKKSITESNLEELLDHLNRDGDSWSYTDLDVAFPQSVNQLDPDDIGTYTLPKAEGLVAFDAFNAEQQAAAEAALQLWEDISGLTFSVVAPGEAADVYFFGRESEDYPDGSGIAGQSTGVDEEDGSKITINTAKSAWTNMGIGDSGFNTLIHEIGHTIGFDHPGDYDGGDGATYEEDAEYIQDTDKYTVMSYFDANNNDASDSSGLVMTPRTHDIWTAQHLYGANWDTRTDDTTYGFEVSAGLEDGVFDFNNYVFADAPHLTIWDADGIDTLNLLGDFNEVEVDLNPGAFSSVLGGVNNLSLALPPPEVTPAGKNYYIENARGSWYNDVLKGNATANVLEGMSGNDTLEGRAGSDTLIGGSGDDTLDGGAGSDTADYSDSDDAMTINLTLGTATDNELEDDVLISIEAVQGGGGNDVIIGNHSNNLLKGGAGWDEISAVAGINSLLGEEGNDRLKSGNFTDVLNGGSGMDTAVYDSSPFGVQVDLAIAGQQNTGGAGFDTLISIERLEGSTLDDVLKGDDWHNILKGHNGDDVIEGREGNDLLYGGFGNDELEGGEGDDHLIGGDGEDTASYYHATGGVFVSLGAAGAVNTISAGLDVYNSIENVEGSFHDDAIYGDAQNNRIFSGNGSDFVSGGGGADEINAGSGNDIIAGGASNDVMNGGAGIDWVLFFSGAGIQVDLSEELQWTGEGSDTIKNIENARGWMGDDELRGDAGANHLMGLSGDDLIVGGGGEDVLEGGLGDDTIYVGTDEPFDPVGDFDEAVAGASSARESEPLFVANETTSGGGMQVVAGMQTVGGLKTDGPTRGGGGMSPFDEYAGEPGSGPDVIIFQNNWGNDEVYGFYSDGDKLDFSSVNGVNGIVHLSIGNTADGVLISYGDDSVLLHDVVQAELSDSDFIF